MNDVLKIEDPKTGEIKYIVTDEVIDVRSSKVLPKPHRKSRFLQRLKSGITRIIGRKGR